jgi:hypothetical protein
LQLFNALYCIVEQGEIVIEVGVFFAHQVMNSN